MDTSSINTDRLIERLAAEVRPVRRLVDPTRRAALWTAVALVCVAVGVVYFGVRHNLGAAMGSATYVARVGLLGATMWLAVVSAFRMAVPGYERRVWARWWPLVALGALMAVTAAELTTAAVLGQAGAPLAHWTCVRKLALVGAVPAVFAILLIERAAPLDPVWTALLGMLAAGSAGALTSELACPLREPMHVMLWHVLPVAVAAGAGTMVVVLGLRLLRR